MGTSSITTPTKISKMQINDIETPFFIKYP